MRAAEVSTAFSDDPKNRAIQLTWLRYVYVPRSSMFSEFCVPETLCCDTSMFPMPYVPGALRSKSSVFLEVCVSDALLPELYVPDVLCS